MPVSLRSSFGAADAVECGADDATGVAGTLTAGGEACHVWML